MSVPDLWMQYGCGLSSGTGWLNFDASPTLRLQRLPLAGRLFRRFQPLFPADVRYGDVVRGLPVAASSCAAIYCSHVLEHLAREDFRVALRETYRCLGPGGVFRLVMPDLRTLCTEYLEADNAGAAGRFLEESMLGTVTRPRRPMAILRQWIGNSAHLWLWDYASTAAELEAAGFTSIRPAKYGDSEQECFKIVEIPDRWQRCLGVECRKG